MTPSRPVSVSAARRALTTAASVASTVALNSGVIRLSSTIRTSWVTGAAAPGSSVVGEAPVAGREREEEVARRVVRGAAHAREAERRPLGEPLALVREQRRVGRDDHDDRARSGLGAWPGAASVRRRVRLVGDRRRVVRRRHLGDRDRRADRDAVDRSCSRSP